MREQAGVPLAQLTTLRLGGPARRLVVASSEDELVDTVLEADASNEPVLVLGGGSNLVVADEGFDGLVVQVRVRGLDYGSDGRVVAAAGEDWDGLVSAAVAAGLAGVEALSGIPGLVGATPIQNVGAYGQDVAQTVESVRVLDRVARQTRVLNPAECEFGYRSSVFRHSERFVVLAVGYRLTASRIGGPVQYAELARRLEVELGGSAPLPDVREAVLGLRARKGMVLDPLDHDTWSVGSFFTNPILDARLADSLLPDGAPRWPERNGHVKTSAAWLIEQAGFGKGYGQGPARVSTKHTLALTNRGGASTSDLISLAREIRDGVRSRFGVALVNEPVLVGCSL